jgi:hypothetical protein
MILIVPTCYGYRDAWNPFFQLKKIFWPDCPFDTVLVTDQYEVGHWSDQVFVVGHDEGWCKNLSTAIRSTRFKNEDYFLMMQEDFFLNDPVDTEFVNYAIDLMERDSDIGCFRLFPCPGPDIVSQQNPDMGFVSPGARYRISCQGAIWRKSYILQILDRCNTTMDFELKGTEISSYLQGVVLSITREKKRWPLPYLCTAIVRGGWHPDAIKLCKSHGIPVDSTRRINSE